MRILQSAVMPVRSSLPWESRWTSTSNTLTWLSSRAAGAMRATFPSKRTLGKASRVTVTGASMWTLPMSTSLTPTLTIMLLTSATVPSTVPALKEPAPVTVSPSSTGRVMTTPSIGEVMLRSWLALALTGMPEALSSSAFSLAAASVSLAAL